MNRIYVLTLSLTTTISLIAQQSSLTIKNATFTPSAHANYIFVEFSQAVSPPAKASVTLQDAPGVSITDVTPEPGRQEYVDVFLDQALPAGSNAKLCFAAVSFSVNHQPFTTNSVCAAVSSINSPDIKQRRDSLLAELNKVTKTSAEKDVFASGFVTTASSGTQGGAQLALNPDLGIKGMSSFLNINKTTQAGADPKNFEAGTRYRYVRSLSAPLMQAAANTAPGAALDEIVRQAQQKMVAGLLFDLAGKLEGEATNFNVSNFVGEASISFRSLSRAFASKTGYVRGFVTPFAFEGGKNLNTQGQPLQTPAGTPAPNSPNNVDYIARYKTGLGLDLFYEDWNSSLPIKRVDLDVSAVGRYLFLKESMYDTKAKSVNSINNGFREYAEVALKLYVGQSSSGRYGLKLSYDRGSLPPVFARVKSFQFGFLFESNEDSSKK